MALRIPGTGVSENTRVGWADDSGNAAAGCSEATLVDGTMSKECLNCYARLGSARLPLMMRAGAPSPRKERVAGLYDGVATRIARGARWTGVLRWDRDMLREILGSARPGHVLFFGSMTDLWHAKHDPALGVELAATIREIARRPRKLWPRGVVTLTKRALRQLAWQREHFPDGLPPFCWPGVTAGYQASANERVFPLCELRAHVRVVSVEPLLGDLNLQRVPGTFDPAHESPSDGRHLSCLYDALQGRAYVGRGMTLTTGGGRIGWVIAGCESGRHRRPTNAAWLRDLRDQCVRSRVPFFLKQMDVDGKVTTEPVLDGRRWLQMPDRDPYATGALLGDGVTLSPTPKE